MTDKYVVTGGSHAFGLEHANSDFDTYYVYLQSPNDLWHGFKLDYNEIPKAINEEQKVISLHEFVSLIAKQKSLVPFEILFSNQIVEQHNANFMGLFLDNKHKLFGKTFLEYLIKSAKGMYYTGDQSPKTLSEIRKRLFIAETLLLKQPFEDCILTEKQIEICRTIRYNENYFIMHEKSIRNSIVEHIRFLEEEVQKLEENQGDIIELVFEIMEIIYQELK